MKSNIAPILLRKDEAFMVMDNLPSLYYAMLREARIIEGFNFKLKGVTLDVVFAIDSEPFTLLIGIKTHNFFFTVPVYRGFWVNALEDSTFYALRNLLGFEKQGEKFTSLKFLAEVNGHTPSHCAKKPLQPHELFEVLPPEERRKVEAADKKYFVRWDYHRNDGRKARNFEKTRIMTGSQEIAAFCRAHNISSVWTDRVEERKTLTTPLNNE